MGIAMTIFGETPEDRLLALRQQNALLAPVQPKDEAKR